MTTQLNKLRNEIVNKFLADLNNNVIPWHKAWNATGAPRNAITGKPYKGLNRLWLSVNGESAGYRDNRWCTFNQAKSAGYKIKPGEHGYRIEYWSMYDKELKRDLSVSEVNKRREELQLQDQDWRKIIIPVSKEYVVFNAEQIIGMPPVEKTVLPDNEELINNRDKLINELNITLVEGGNTACYVPDKDEIRMPFWEDFKSEYGYMATFLHETAHATGAEHRLNRNIKNAFGTPDYAKEELRAELASTFMSQLLGFGNVERLDNHSAYIQSWIKVLNDEPNELFAAAKEAEEISEYILEKGGFEIVKQEIIMPDAKVTDKDLVEYGYYYEKMLPLTKDTAIQLFHDGVTIFTLYEDNTESMIDCMDDIVNHDGLFGIERDIWLKKLEDNLNTKKTEQVVAKERENAREL